LEKPLSAILDKNRQKSIEGRRESRERTTEQLEQEGFTERISEVQCGGSRSCGATALMGKIPLIEEQPAKKTPAVNSSSEPIVATVEGNQVTVMNGQTVIKTTDSELAALIAEKMNEGE